MALPASSLQYAYGLTIILTEHRAVSQVVKDFVVIQFGIRRSTCWYRSNTGRLVMWPMGINLAARMRVKIFSVFLSLVAIGSAAITAADGLVVTREDLLGPDGTRRFGTTVTVLSSGNYVVYDPAWSSDGVDNVGAVFVYDGETNQLLSTLTGKSWEDTLHSHIVPLGNGNFLFVTPNFDHQGVTDVGAVTWVDGSESATRTISVEGSLVGLMEKQRVGAKPNVLNHDVTVLRDGNYVILNEAWGESGVADLGAVTWGSGVSGVSGNITSSNSLIGTKKHDFSAAHVLPLRSGNYVVGSPFWDNGEIIDAGAVTWGDGDSALNGHISVESSLIGSSEHERVGAHIVQLRNGNYVSVNGAQVAYTGGNCDNCVTSATWADQDVGIVGQVSSSNSLMSVGTEWTMEVLPLHNGNYVVSRPGWNRDGLEGVGAVTWGDGLSGVTGEMSAGNSLIGTLGDDRVGERVIDLPNGNFVVLSQLWNGGRGAATWGDGLLGAVGEVSPENSFTGPTEYAQGLGQWGAIQLVGGNYLVTSYIKSQGGTVHSGQMITWGDGASKSAGEISTSNSFFTKGHSDPVIPLPNGNYIILQETWSAGAGAPSVGAVTWGDGSVGVFGSASTLNSLVGRNDNDLRALVFESNEDGNYVVSSPLWDSDQAADVGALTWVNGATGLVGPITPENSLIGLTTGDCIGGVVNACHGLGTGNYGFEYERRDNGVHRVGNGNFVVASPLWNNDTTADVGAVTWIDGKTGRIGTVTNQNSLVGSTTGDQIGERVEVFRDGNYVVISEKWDSDDLEDAGAVTWADGAVRMVGSVSAENSLIGFGEFGTRDGELDAGFIQQDAAFVSDLYACNFCEGGVVIIAARGLVGSVTASNSASIIAPSPGEMVKNPFDYIDHSGRRLTSSDTLPVPTSANRVVLLQINGLPPSDMDKDGLEDDVEITLYGTDPNNPDTDGDGVLDGADAFPLDPERWAIAVPALPSYALLFLGAIAGLFGLRGLRPLS
ncbi:hypothetical protein GPB2148_1288 [marine gamma proteobacterium HTCC2148]|nr:hypothetical protein GPB2148_1288 [marine gamma proteobacterium HTCC2148]